MNLHKPVKLTGTILIWLLSSAISGQQNPSVSILEGVFNEAQAVRGQALYYQYCLNCHGETMEGVDKAPPLAGPLFSNTWLDAPLAAVVARILTMPPEKPGALTQAESVDVLTYILWYNGLPLGEQELASDMRLLTELTFHTPATN
jgi:cytochrome c